MKLLFLRHGLAEHNQPGFVGDQSRAQLTAVGQKQAQTAGQRIAAAHELAGIYASPWFRTCQTAKIVASCLPSVMVVWPDKRLTGAEISLAGRFWRSVPGWRPRSPAVRQHRAWAQKLRQPSVLAATSDPVAGFVDDLRLNHPAQTILVVAHLPTYWVVCHLLTGEPIKRITNQRPFLAPGAWAEFNLAPLADPAPTSELVAES